MKPQHYECELSWGWSGNISYFNETSRFSILEMEDLDKVLKNLLIKIARKHSMDCGRPENPLFPSITSLRIVPVYETICMNFYEEDNEYRKFFENEVQYSRELAENGNLYEGSGYNMNISPLNMK